MFSEHLLLLLIAVCSQRSFQILKNTCHSLKIAGEETNGILYPLIRSKSSKGATHQIFFSILGLKSNYEGRRQCILSLNNPYTYNICFVFRNELTFAIKSLVMLTAYHFMKNLSLNGKQCPTFSRNDEMLQLIKVETNYSELCLVS